MEINRFFAMLSRMKYINRWGLMRNTNPETISEHSLQTGFIAHALALIGNRRLGKSYNAERAALLAIFHDAPEIITGDMPTPVKYHSPEIHSAYQQVESIAIEQLLALLPEDLATDYRSLLTYRGESDASLHQLVKAADKISAVIKCVEEMKSGNSEFVSAERSLRRTISAMALPEAELFMEECLPAFAMTLDELQESFTPHNSDQ